MDQIVKLVAQTKELLDRHSHAHVIDFMTIWPTGKPVVPSATNCLPVLDWMPAIAEDACTAKTYEQTLALMLAELSTDQHWRQTYTADDFGPEFLKRYGWMMVVGPTGLIQSDSLLCAILMLGPEIEYPYHSHKAEEIYITLAGKPAFRLEGEPWATRQSGDVVYHAPWVPHAIRSGDEPSLILCLWRNGDLTQKSRIHQ